MRKTHCEQLWAGLPPIADIQPNQGSFQPRASAHSRASACGLRAGHRPASTSKAHLPAADDLAVGEHVVVRPATDRTSGRRRRV
jgi:hypothetical protein